MIDWKIYYKNYTWDSTQGIENAPTTGVILICSRDIESVWRTITGTYYIWDNRGNGFQWHGIETEDAFYEYLFSIGLKKILFGKTYDNNLFNQVYNNATEEWGKLTGWNYG